MRRQGADRGDGQLITRRRKSSPGAGPRIAPGPVLSALLLVCCLLAFALPAAADPDYGSIVLPGIDPLLRSTDDPALLGVPRLLVREYLMEQGADPLTGRAGPTLASAVHERIHRRLKLDLKRMITVTEVSPDLGIETVFTYPDYFFLFQPVQDLPNGFVWYPPRRIDAPELQIFVDDADRAMKRRMAVVNTRNWREGLDVGAAVAAGRAGGGLINLTIPIKLPRTLEKIIGRGEKTNIRISGREHISIAGESTMSNRFTPTERRKSQSLFPTLDMEQQLQLNLSGQIGEKILIEVDHNSEAIGPDATKIRLTYQGSEDEIIQTIETGDVGLTLPGSQLLGYSSNKSGLFGIKVTGQVGRADFTVVASKQKAESASQQFNSKGGSVSDHIIDAWRYLNNRFFRLDLNPNDPSVSAFYESDFPGRPAGAQIDLNTVRIFRFMGSVTEQDGDVRNVVAVVDTAGVWDAGYQSWLNSQLAVPTDIVFEYGDIWRQIDFEVLRDESGNLVAVDLMREYSRSDILAVAYDVVDSAGELLYRVGDIPNLDEGSRVEIGPGEPGTLYYRMKLLKPQDPETYTWQYVLRNIYQLGGSNIDSETFEFRIEANTPVDFPERDFSGLDWFRIFGLDRYDNIGEAGHDDLPDANMPYIFDLQAGLLKFPLDFPFPFNAPQSKFESYADDESFIYSESFLAGNLMPAIYDPATTEQDLKNGTKFSLVASHAAASSSFNLGVSNIEEGSESVVLDGRTLTREQDYEIDYMFGEIMLKGEAASTMGPDSQISVNYQYAPFLGGGNSNLMGFNLGYSLSDQNRLSTTWLYETNNIAGHKPKLGEEPSRTLVGNVNGQLSFKPYFLTHVANLLSRVDSERESTFQVNGEMAMSFPNPNTRDEVYLEDFEGIDSSDVMPISRLSWSESSLPRHGEDLEYAGNEQVMDNRVWQPEGRVTTRWFVPRVNVLRRNLNPTLKEQEGREVQQTLQMYLRSEDGEWTDGNWGGIMRGMGRSGVDLTKAQFLEFWVNDFNPSPESRHGTLHFDFGIVNEDFYWPVDEITGEPVLGTFDQEDRDRNGVFMIDEDTGLGDDPTRDRFSADFVSDADPYPYINGTAGNNREDTEDLDGDSNLDRRDGFFTLKVDLSDSALVDVMRDYDPSLLADNIAKGLAWRKYRIRLDDMLPVVPSSTGTMPNLAAVTHVRVWYEAAAPQPGETELDMQFSEIRFVGSRWEKEGIRVFPTAAEPDEELVDEIDLAPGEGYFIGEVNNKENPDYVPPFSVHEELNIPEKEQSGVVDFQSLSLGHMVRVSRQVSTRGDDYTLYNTLSWYVYNPDLNLGDLDYLFRIGADTLNYYEVSSRFDSGVGPEIGWREMRIDVAELSNSKLGEFDPLTGWVISEVHDKLTGEAYPVRVVGSPDLRRVKRYYFGIANNSQEFPVSGYFYFNDIKLREVKRESGMAERVALSVNMADVIKADFDWSRRDADFHGLNSSTGQGYVNTDWNFSTSLRVNDFVPLLGFNMPVSVGRQMSINRPKYLTNSDIEILDDDLRNAESTINERESFSVRLMHDNSRWAIARYLIDPWSFSISGSRRASDSSLNKGRQKSLSGSVSYDLRFPREHLLGEYLFFGRLPLVKSVGVLPNKVSLSGNFSGSQQRTRIYDSSVGTFIDRPTTKTKRGTLNGTVDFKPLPIANVGVTVTSERDMFRERWLLGLNIGEENIFKQRVQVKFLLPKKLGLPDVALLRPLVKAVRAMHEIKPSVNFDGTYENNHGPTVRQAGDPPDVRSAGSNGDWTLRGTLPVNKVFSGIFPKKQKMSDSERKARIDRERKLKQRNKRRGGPDEDGGAAADTTAADGLALSDEERRRQEEDELISQAIERDEAEAAERGEKVELETDTEGGVGVPNPFTPFLDLMRNSAPVQVSYSTRHRSAYVRMNGNTDFWYRLGILSELDLPDTNYATRSLTDSRSITMSSGVKFSRTANLDVKFNRQDGSRTDNVFTTRNLQEDWPDLHLALSGLERMGIFGGGGEDRALRSANFDFGYKYSKSVSGYTESFYNPRTSTTISPRLNLAFRSGMSASLNVNHVTTDNEQNGSLSQSRQLSISAQVRHKFRAEALLSKLHLYKPGNVPMVSLDVDLSFSRSVTNRWSPTSTRDGDPDTETGRSSYSINPRLSYTITRNLSGAMRLIYSRSKVFESDSVNTTLGVGLEATFVF